MNELSCKRTIPCRLLLCCLLTLTDCGIRAPGLKGGRDGERGLFVGTLLVTLAPGAREVVCVHEVFAGTCGRKISGREVVSATSASDVRIHDTTSY